MRISELKGAVAAYVEQNALNGSLHGLKCTAEFPARKAAPLREPLLVVGLAGAALSDGGFGGYLGDGADGAALYGKFVELSFFFDAHCPPAQAQVLDAVCDALCDVLLLKNPFGFYKMRRGDAAFDKDTGALRLRIYADLRAAVSHADETLQVREFRVTADLP